MNKRGWVLFIAMALIWGLPYLFIRIGVETLSPFFVVFSRVGLAALVLLPIAVFTGQLKQLKGHWKWVMVFAIVEMTFPFGALTFAEMRITSSLAGLLVAAVPIVSAFIAWRIGLDDRINKTRLIGLLIGIAGVVALVGLDVRGGDLLSVALVGITVVGYAFGPMIITLKLADAPPLAVIAASVSITAIIYTPFAIATWPQHALTGTEWFSILMLGLLCTAIAFLIFFQLIAEVGPARTTVITYLNPAVALILGVIVLAEPITVGLLIGFPLVLIGSYLATRKNTTPELEFLEDQPHA